MNKLLSHFLKLTLMKSKTGHLIGWLLFISLILTFFFRESGWEAAGKLLLTRRFWLFLLFYMAVFYLNTEWLLPRFFHRGSYVVYSLISVLFLGIVYSLAPFENLVFQQIRGLRQPVAAVVSPPPRQDPALRPADSPPPGRPRPERRENQRTDIVSIVLWGMVWAIGMFAAASGQWQKAQETALQSQADKVKAELAFLKAQINPHFLFNTLSNLYALAVVKSDETAPGILKLSDLMRYLVEESSSDSVLLTREVSFIENYIRLQELRLNEKTRVDFRVSGLRPEARIAPMILITFIENAFKYGVSANREVLIRICLTLEGRLLDLYCSNQIVNRGALQDGTGIGIGNTRQRLTHHYGGRHQLDIHEKNDIFEVRLRIDIGGEEIKS